MPRCETCGEPFEHTASKAGGRPPKHCPAHRRPSGAKRDKGGNARRKNARARAKRASVAKAVLSADAHSIAELASALSIFRDPATAASVLGIQAGDGDLARLVERARTEHKGIVEGDTSELWRRCIGIAHLFALSLLKHREEIAPRDLPHAMRALAQVGELVGGGTQRFSEITLVVEAPPEKP